MASVCVGDHLIATQDGSRFRTSTNWPQTIPRVRVRTRVERLDDAESAERGKETNAERGGGRGCPARLKNTRFLPPLNPFNYLSVKLNTFHVAAR